MSFDVLAIGAHPDDVELGCGATLALLARSGKSVGILHLTSGEAGTRGDAETRRREASAAAEVLGAEVEFLDFGDGGLGTGADEEDQLIERLRRSRPRLVFGPAPRDRHPDHARAHALVRDACFYAGLAKRCPKRGAAHRPEALFSYLQHDVVFEPSFVVDVTSTWATKMRALDCYSSQIHRSGDAGETAPGGPSTKTSSPEFRQAIEGRSKHYGLLVSAAYGEPFHSVGPLAVSDPWSLVA